MKLSLALVIVSSGAILATALAVGCSSSSSPATSGSSGDGASAGDDGGGAGDDATVSSGASSGNGSGGSSGSSSGSSSGGKGGGTGTGDAAAAPVSDAGLVLATDGAVVEDYVPKPADFDCLKGSEWTTVGLSRFKNVLGHKAEMLAVANSPTGGDFPVGTFVQLVPFEASVKRGPGYSPASHDWEFFALTVSASGATVNASGGDAMVKNFLGASCLNCHGKAKPQWDLLCGDADGGTTHGCDPLGISGPTLTQFQNSDQRCP